MIHNHRTQAFGNKQMTNNVIAIIMFELIERIAKETWKNPELSQWDE